jgi:hypothetical protein
MHKKIIAHRGNLEGPSKQENSIQSIYKCFDLDLDVEIDVWWHKGSFWLGHDEPHTLLTTDRILRDQRLWCHAKNLEAAFHLRRIDAHYFWHQEDDFTLTSKGFFWTYPGKPLTENSIAVMPEWQIHEETFSSALGVCTDFPLRYIL